MKLTKFLSSYKPSFLRQPNMTTPQGVRNNHEDSFGKKIARLSPMGHLSYNHEVAGALFDLLSDASSYVAGDNILVEGGMNVW